MLHDAKTIANWFVRRAAADDRVLSIMTLLKLIYVAHGWHLEIFKRPLFANNIEAWKFGPVVPDVYNSFRSQGIEIRSIYPTMETELEPEQENLLNEVYGIYSRMGAFQLSEITHVPNGPWDLASKRHGFFAKIPNGVIQEHYELLRKRASEDHGLDQEGALNE